MLVLRYVFTCFKFCRIHAQALLLDQTVIVMSVFNIFIPIKPL